MDNIRPLVPSRFNVVTNRWGKHNAVLVYNTLTDAIVEVSNNFYTDYFDEQRGAPLDYESTSLLNGHFLVPREFDELQVLRQLDDRRLTERIFNLDLSLTMECNFACGYCFERKRSTRIASILPETLSFIQDLASSVDELRLSFSGGEPLLELPTIEYALTAVKRICEEAGCSFSQDRQLITNGSLLTKQALSKLKEMGFERFQVTLDGPASIHNARRPYRSGTATFKTIIRNTQSAIEQGFHINLRVNVGKDNVGELTDLVDCLFEYGILPVADIYFAPVLPNTPVSSAEQEIELSMPDFARTYVQVMCYVISKGGRLPHRPKMKLSSHCMANKKHSIVISPEGRLHKCHRDMSFCERDAGTVKNPSLDNDYAQSYLLHSAFRFEECMTCSILPLCNGGCAYNSFYYQNSGAPDCITLRHNVKDMLNIYVLHDDIEKRSIPHSILDQTENSIRREHTLRLDY